MSDQRLNSAARGYGSRWQKYRAKYLLAHPLCVMHQARGQAVAATVVDHIEPHKGDHRLFWKPDNHQALCKHCHDAHKRRLELSGTEIGCNVDGQPISKTHHWNRQGG